MPQPSYLGFVQKQCMKNTLSLLAACLSCLIVHAQNATTAENSTLYLTFCGLAAAEPFFSGTKQGALNVSFPYKVTDAAGMTADSVFHSRTIHPFAPLKVFIIPLSLEIGDRHFFVLARLSPVLMGDGGADAGYRYSLGCGRNFFIGRGRSGRRQGKSLVIKPSLNIEYITYRGRDNGSPFYLGTIDNHARAIQFDGDVANPTYTYTTGSYANTVTHIDSVHLLNIYYGQREWIIQPKLTFSNSPYQHRFHWEVYIGYTLPFSQKGKLIFTQDDDHGVATKNMKDNAFLVQYNNAVVKTTPYYLNGLNIGFALGVNASRQLNRTGKRSPIF
jgi:hypothetical protein